MPPYDVNDQGQGWEPPQPPPAPDNLPPDSGGQDYGQEAAVAFARAKLEALLTEKNPEWRPPEPAPGPMAEVPANTYQLPVAQSAQQQDQPMQIGAPPHPIYPTPTQPIGFSRPANVTPPETIPQAQYDVETALQDEITPVQHHIDPSHQLPAEQSLTALPAAPLSQFQTLALPGAPVVPPPAQSPGVVPASPIVPPPSLHAQPQPSRSEQIRAHASTVRSAAQRAQHGFIRPILRSTIITLVVFLIYNAPLVMGQIYYYITPATTDSTPVILDPSVTAVSADPRIIISKLNIDVPAVYDEESFDEKKIQQALERGIVHYGTTALPGEKGNAVFLGHSSNSPWTPGRFKTAFSLLRKLQVNDTFVLHYQKKRYIYQVYERKVIDPSDFSVISQDVKNPIVTLITCDPPGANWNRLVIHARQISPDPSANTPHKGSTAVPHTGDIPGTPQSLWQRVTSIF